MISRERLLRMLSDDLASDGHTLGEDVRNLSADDLASFANILSHWNFQLQREIRRRTPSGDRLSVDEQLT